MFLVLPSASTSVRLAYQLSFLDWARTARHAYFEISSRSASSTNATLSPMSWTSLMLSRHHHICWKRGPDHPQQYLNSPLAVDLVDCRDEARIGAAIFVHAHLVAALPTLTAPASTLLHPRLLLFHLLAEDGEDGDMRKPHWIARDVAHEPADAADVFDRAMIADTGCP